jgi:hypothetical protein
MGKAYIRPFAETKPLNLQPPKLARLITLLTQTDVGKNVYGPIMAVVFVFKSALLLVILLVTPRCSPVSDDEKLNRCCDDSVESEVFGYTVLAAEVFGYTAYAAAGHTCYTSYTCPAAPAAAGFTSCDRWLLYVGASFRPRPSSSRRDFAVILLLLMAGVEPNPGPQPWLNFAIQNARSVVTKAAVIHDLIADMKLDLLAITETWVPSDAPDTVKLDVTPPGYAVVHRARGAYADKRGGGIALVHRESLKAHLLDLSPSTDSEALAVKVHTPTSHRPLIVVTVYRAPSIRHFATRWPTCSTSCCRSAIDSSYAATSTVLALRPGCSTPVSSMC